LARWCRQARWSGVWRSRSAELTSAWWLINSRHVTSWPAAAARCSAVCPAAPSPISHNPPGKETDGIHVRMCVYRHVGIHGCMCVCVYVSVWGICLCVHRQKQSVHTQTDLTLCACVRTCASLSACFSPPSWQGREPRLVPTFYRGVCVRLSLSLFLPTKDAYRRVGGCLAACLHRAVAAPSHYGPHTPPGT
jgi:hypothetical protein